MKEIFNADHFVYVHTNVRSNYMRQLCPDGNKSTLTPQSLPPQESYMSGLCNST